METSLDKNVGQVYVVPQDIGRVFLNLFNNAFYSVREKQRRLGNGYEPSVQVRTQKRKGEVEISIRDNGSGIPSKMMDKIFQPFYTTKPTGDGTGLGLSISYDIITKEHGGSLQVDSSEGEYAQFSIVLPAMELNTTTK
jgi:signal transduction histidine kinase